MDWLWGVGALVLIFGPLVWLLLSARRGLRRDDDDTRHDWPTPR